MPVIAGHRESIKEIVQAGFVGEQAGVWLCYQGSSTSASRWWD